MGQQNCVLLIMLETSLLGQQICCACKACRVSCILSLTLHNASPIVSDLGKFTFFRMQQKYPAATKLPREQPSSKIKDSPGVMKCFAPSVEKVFEKCMHCRLFTKNF